MEQIGKYKIIGKIGQGAMGEVWKAHDPVLNRFVAIKTIAAASGADETLRKRFQREAQSAAHLNHPNIITVFDFGEEQGQIYMAMELLEGTDLKEVITSQALAELQDKLDVMEQICDGLAYAHSKDVVHRDLKPGNIHIQPSGQVKIMDFGLARLGSSDMTREGMILGTPNYMSPEQVRGEKADARSDIFSLGAVFYELLSNRKPFDADSLHAVLFNVLQQEPEPVRKWCPELPQVLVDLVEKALAKDPAERLQHGGEMRETLRGVRKAFAEGWVGEPTMATMAVNSLFDELGEAEPPPEMPPASRSKISSGIRPKPAVEGSAALDDVRDTQAGGVRLPITAQSRAGTLSGRAATQSGVPSPSRSGVQEAPSAEPGLAGLVPPSSRMPVVIGSAAGVIVLGIALVFVLRHKPGGDTAPPSTLANPQVNQLTQALADSQVELARRNLQDKDYAGAQAQAERALKLDPASAEARAILDEATRTRQDLDAAAAEARKALDAGNSEAASRGLARILALDPKHPAAAELSQKLNSRFRGQADEARRSMDRARASASRAKADSQAAFADAAAFGREGESLAAKGDFAVATQKFLAARDGFERARRGAEAAAHPTAPPVTLAAAPVTTPMTVPPVTAPAPTLPPVTAPPVTAAPVTLPPATLPPNAAVNDDAAIRRVVSDYGRAIESKDIELFRALKPNLSPEDEGRLRDSFRNLESQKVSITIQSIDVSGTTARVRVSRRDTINNQSVNAFNQTLVLGKGPGGWTIREIGR